MGIIKVTMSVIESGTQIRIAQTGFKLRWIGLIYKRC